jgi:redox-sensitive bicupin YhaK (pirin superfamily)
MSAILRRVPLQMPWKTQDPFLFCVHHLDNYPQSNGEFAPAQSLQGRQLGQDFSYKDGWSLYHGHPVPGFPAHPHRGFETITVVEQGIVDHTDSLGAAGRYGAGDTQWMTAGKGVQHAEMFPLLHEDQDNTLELFQIWLNLPAKSKMVEPHFKMLWADQVPVREMPGVSVKVVAGNLLETQAVEPPPESWAAEATNQVVIALISMEAGSEFSLSTAENGVNRSLYLFEGTQVGINGENEAAGFAYELDALQAVSLKASEACKLLLLQGKAINENVVQYGPFVMNSEQEIQQAFADYRQTEFGGWPWPKASPVHTEATTRFAKHANGEQETRALD